MSNKTIFKRIALVAVAALGAGLLTVTPASATNNGAAGDGNAAHAAGILNVATAASTTGSATLTALISTNRSLGLLSNSTTLTTSSLSSTATMRADGEIVFYYQDTSTDETITSVVIDGGGYVNQYLAEHSTDADGDGGTDLSATATDPTIKINAARTHLVTGADANDDISTVFSVKPTTGSTSFTVSVYESAAQGTASAAAMSTALSSVLSGATSKGTLKQRYTVTVVTASAGGTYSSVYSYVQGVNTATTVAASNTDEAGSLKKANAASAVAYIAIKLQDAYDVTLDNVGAVSISGTNGAGIAYNKDNDAATPTNTVAVTNDASGTITVARPAAFANKAFSTTVTIQYNGVTVATKSILFYGEVAKITATQYKPIARVGALSTYQGQIEYTDDKGNVIDTVTTGTSAKSSTLNSVVSSVAIGDWADSDDPVSYYNVECNSLAGSGFYGGTNAGSADVVFRHTNPFSGSIIESNPVKISCAGDAVTYTASLDKASYAPGDIATLTITGKDNAGNLANGEKNFQSATSGSEFTVTAPQMTPVTAISTSSVKFSSGAGVKTYKFVVGNTEGSYNLIVAIPTINAALLGGANQTVAYKIAAPSTGAVTNAEVLAAIVKLIASINKQIRALQKSLKR